jgi:hypothetical protein
MLKVLIRGQRPQLAIELWQTEMQPHNMGMSKGTILLILEAGAASRAFDFISTLHSAVASQSPALLQDADILCT